MDTAMAAKRLNTFSAELPHQLTIDVKLVAYMRDFSLRQSCRPAPLQETE